MICVSIGTENKLKQIEFSRKFNFVEYRLDLCKPERTFLKSIIYNTNRIIISFRNTNDLYFLDDLPYSEIEYFDFDLSLIDHTIEETLNVLQDKLIISAHPKRFNKQLIDRIIAEASYFKPQIIKVAVYISDETELNELLSIYDKKQDFKLILIGMGIVGLPSRLQAIKMGAPFTYAAPELGFETAAGQLTYDELLKLQYV